MEAGSGRSSHGRHMNYKNKNGWPPSRSVDNESKKWKHSDLREIAYPYVFGLFDKFTSQGKLDK